MQDTSAEMTARDETIFTDARWIWDGGDLSPRNAWRLFRRAFEIEDGPGSVEVRITADTRYVLHVNGERVGQGPARGFPDHWFVDTWHVGHLLQPGRRNVIAVHVLHFGVATFQSLKTRGGLLAEVVSDATPMLVTDNSWRVCDPDGFEPRSNRMSCQLGFVEFVDARAFPVGWTRPEFDDSGWQNATDVGPVGTPPWTALVPRDIPPLQEQFVRPTHVERLAFVQPIHQAVVIDIRCHMDPHAANHANQIAYAGYLVTILRVHESTEISLIFGWGRVGCAGIDGDWAERSSMEHGPDDQLALTRFLTQGDHLVIVDVSTIDHGHGLRIGIDGPASFISHTAGESPFATIGPIGESPDPNAVFPPVPGIDPELRKQIRGMRSAGDAEAVGHLLRPVSPDLVSPFDLFTLSTRPSERVEVPVPGRLQRFVGGQGETVPIEPGRDTEIILDMGRELSGYPVLDLEAPAGVTIDAFGFEYLRGDHRENPLLLDNSFRYTTCGGRQRYVSPTRRGLRFLQLTIRSSETRAAVVIHDVGMLESHFPVSRVGQFRCSDPVLEDIYEMCRRTVIACMEDTWVDCPAFEQTYWVGDAFNTARFATWLFGAESLTERCIRLVAQSACQNPLLASQVPSGWVSVIPNWTFFWVMTAREHWLRTGDESFARDLWRVAQDALQAYLQHLDDNGLFAIDAWNLLDWAPIDQPNSGVVTHQNCILVIALRAAADLSDVAGDAGGSRKFRETADELAAAIDRHLWSDDEGAYIDAVHADGHRSSTVSVHGQMFALLAEVPSGARKERLERLLLDPPEHWVRIGSPWMSAFLYDMLADIGHAEVALDHIRENYGRMLRHGATTCWEMYPESNFVAGQDRLSRSHCHAWSAAPARFLPQRILGVQPLDPGWTRIEVRPEPCGLLWAEGRVPLPREGWIDVSWRIGEDGCMAIDVSAPDEVEMFGQNIQQDVRVETNEEQRL